MTTTAQAFDAFIATIAPTDAQQEDIQSKRASTERLLKDAFPASSTLPVNRVVLIGSADRGTIVRPVDDIDVMAEFINKDGVFETYRHDSHAFLARIRAALNARTSIQSIGVRGQAVRLFYVNGAHVDIAPVFKWSGDGYALPSGTGDWITTDPEAQADWYAERNRSLGNNLTRLVKLLRRWNNVHSRHYQPYHLEVSAATTFASLGRDSRANLREFFSWAPNYLSVSDPARHSGVLDGYLSWSARQALLSRLATAKDRAVSAKEAELRGDHAEAKRLWRIELGPEFPS